MEIVETHERAFHISSKGCSRWGFLGQLAKAWLCRQTNNHISAQNHPTFSLNCPDSLSQRVVKQLAAAGWEEDLARQAKCKHNTLNLSCINQVPYENMWNQMAKILRLLLGSWHYCSGTSTYLKRPVLYKKHNLQQLSDSFKPSFYQHESPFAAMHSCPFDCPEIVGLCLKCEQKTFVIFLIFKRHVMIISTSEPVLNR